LCLRSGNWSFATDSCPEAETIPLAGRDRSFEGPALPAVVLDVPVLLDAEVVVLGVPALLVVEAVVLDVLALLAPEAVFLGTTALSDAEIVGFAVPVLGTDGPDDFAVLDGGTAGFALPEPADAAAGLGFSAAVALAGISAGKFSRLGPELLLLLLFRTGLTGGDLPFFFSISQSGRVLLIRCQLLRVEMEIVGRQPTGEGDGQQVSKETKVNYFHWDAIWDCCLERTGCLPGQSLMLFFGGCLDACCRAHVVVCVLVVGERDAEWTRDSRKP
jgi:hypothetical protein